MLGKKSLAIALMGLGLAGSCFAAQNSVQVNFTATVTAETCPFSVTVGNGTPFVNDGTGTTTTHDYNYGSYAVSEVPSTPTKVNLKLACTGESVPFTTVTVNHDAAGGVVGTKVDSKNTKSQFILYNEQGASTKWDQEVSLVKDSGYSVDKFVLFKLNPEDDETVKTGEHKASVIFTAKYE